MGINSNNNIKSEELREALLDLERANLKERYLRMETETLLAGLNVLTSSTDRDKIFTHMLEVLRKPIDFEEAFILSLCENTLKVVAATSPHFLNMEWPLGPMISRLSIGKPLSYFDINEIAEWQAQPAQIKKGICSALYVLLMDHPKTAVMVFTHSQRGFFKEQHLRLSARFAPLASQALNNLDYMIRLENMNNQLQVEIEERHRAQTMAINSSKMAALGEMAGGVAHEINNPLAIIQGRMEQLRQSIKSGKIDFDIVMKIADNVSTTATRIAKIVAGLRSFARDGQYDPMQVIPLDTIVTDTLSLCHEKFTHNGVQLDVSMSDELKQNGKIECRATEICQILINLLNNAYDATESQPKRWIRLDVVDLDHFIEFSVIDSGNGIPKEIQDKMMEPFFTTKEIGKGTGLGLSISNGIIIKHQGKFFVDNDCKNTKITFQLPKKQK